MSKILVGKEGISDVFVYDAKTYEKIAPKSVDFKNGEIVIEDINIRILLFFLLKILLKSY